MTIVIATLAILAGVLLAGALLPAREIWRDLASVSFGFVVVTLGIAVTILRVDEYPRTRPHRAAGVKSHPALVSVAPSPPLMGLPAALPSLPRWHAPMTRPPTGAAAPPLHFNPSIPLHRV